jgi:sugar phosphate isomerase/epimerase
MSLRLAVATEDLNASLKIGIGLAGSYEVSGVRLNSRSEVPADKATSSSIRQILLSVQERRMEVAGLLCPTRHALYDQEFLEPRLNIIRQSMTLAQKLETRELVVRCGRIPDSDAQPAASAPVDIEDRANPFSFSVASDAGPSPATEFSLLCEILNDLTRHGNHVGCVLQLQLSAYSEKLIRRLLAAVTAGPMDIVFDPATAIMTGTNPTKIFRNLYQELGYVRGRDAVRNMDDAGTEVALGDGIVDWTELLPTLQEADYSGWLCVERTGGDNRADDVQRGVSHLKTIIPSNAD